MKKWKINKYRRKQKTNKNKRKEFEKEKKKNKIQLLTFSVGFWWEFIHFWIKLVSSYLSISSSFFLHSPSLFPFTVSEQTQPIPSLIFPFDFSNFIPFSNPITHFFHFNQSPVSFPSFCAHFHNRSQFHQWLPKEMKPHHYPPEASWNFFVVMAARSSLAPPMAISSMLAVRRASSLCRVISNSQVSVVRFSRPLYFDCDSS